MVGIRCHHYALGIGAASFASEGGAGSGQRYSVKPDGGAGTPNFTDYPKGLHRNYVSICDGSRANKED